MPLLHKAAKSVAALLDCNQHKQEVFGKGTEREA